MRISRPKPAAALLLAVALACNGDLPLTGPRQEPAPTFDIVLFAGEGNDHADAFKKGARLAISHLDEERLEGRKIRLVERGPPAGPALAGLISDTDVVGAITAGGRDAIAGSGVALDLGEFPVFELSDDLYETGDLRASVFQLATPHSWQAWRLARYFGPGDRGYQKVALLRQEGPAGEVAASTLAEALRERGVAFVDSKVPPSETEGSTTALEESLSVLASETPDAVVVEGSEAFISRAMQIVSGGERSYRGRSRIHDGWRPQPAGFDSLLWAETSAPPGAVASSDYAQPLEGAEAMPEVRRFREGFIDEFGEQPTGPEVLAYDAVRILFAAAAKAGSVGRAEVVEALEGLDKVRFGRLSISFGPDDRVVPERDVLGLWASTGDPGSVSWAHLMRTFTSDLQRTNILEEDWANFFEGTTPGGEAPFFHAALSGIRTAREDDLH